MHYEKHPEDALKDEELWEVPHMPDVCFKTWRFLKGIDYAHLPFPGGFLDQPEWLWRGVMTMQYRYEIIKAHDEFNDIGNSIG